MKAVAETPTARAACGSDRPRRVSRSGSVMTAGDGSHPSVEDSTVDAKLMLRARIAASLGYDIW